MSETLRAVALLLSLALWSPVAARLLRGDVSADRAALLYAVALLLTLAGCWLLAHLIGAYTPERAHEQDVTEPELDRRDHAGLPAPEASDLGRRQEDAAA